MIKDCYFNMRQKGTIKVVSINLILQLIFILPIYFFLVIIYLKFEVTKSFNIKEPNEEESTFN